MVAEVLARIQCAFQIRLCQYFRCFRRCADGYFDTLLQEQLPGALPHAAGDNPGGALLAQPAISSEDHAMIQKRLALAGHGPEIYRRAYDNSRHGLVGKEGVSTHRSHRRGHR